MDGPTAVALQGSQQADREEADTGAHEERAGESVADVPTEALEGLDRLLLRVRDNEVLQLAHRLLRIVGHSSPFRLGRKSLVAGVARTQ